MFVSTRLLKVANSRSLRPLSFVSTLQKGHMDNKNGQHINYHYCPKYSAVSLFFLFFSAEMHKYCRSNGKQSMKSLI